MVDINEYRLNTDHQKITKYGYFKPRDINLVTIIIFG